MGKRENFRGIKGKSRFALIPFSIFDAMARLRMTTAARAAYCEVYHSYNGRNNGKLCVPCRELGDKLNISHDRAARAMKELTEAGFIKLVTPSVFLGRRTSAEYQLTHLKCDMTGDLPTSDYEKYEPVNPRWNGKRTGFTRPNGGKGTIQPWRKEGVSRATWYRRNTLN
ncbi:MAG: hypothetical protein ACR2KT_16245 [Methylocella sp.]